MVQKGKRKSREGGCKKFIPGKVEFKEFIRKYLEEASPSILIDVSCKAGFNERGLKNALSLHDLAENWAPEDVSVPVIFFDDTSAYVNKHQCEFYSILAERFSDLNNKFWLVGGWAIIHQNHPEAVYTNLPEWLDETCIIRLKSILHIYKYSKFPSPSEIIPHLYLGCAMDAGNAFIMEAYAFRRCFCVAKHPQTATPNENLEVLRYDINDFADQSLVEFFEPITDLMDECISSQQNILIHCQAGRSRSASFVLYYLMKFKKMNLFQSLEHCRARRPIVLPNEGFLRQLLDAEESFFGTRSFAETELEWLSRNENLLKKMLDDKENEKAGGEN